MEARPIATLESEQNDFEQREQRELLDALKRATIGEYDIYSQLGQGGMATVFLALELSLNRPVAIKVISPSALSSTTVIDRFWLEARTAASLSHPHVIPIYSVRSVAGLHFFVMKHIQGGSLDVVLKTEGPFTFSLARTILGQVAGALAYAHRRGVIHRDIKPANIMLDEEGFAVVMDFGIAKVRDVAALTASGAMVGTPLYMSPEQFNGGQVDGRSDQYSLGVVAFELLTGRRPFIGETIPEILRGHLMDKVPDVREFRPECPTSIATLVNRMLCKTPTDRFPSMEALCTELDSMPRINADKVREKIISLARTASLSSPQIRQPISPSPRSRPSAELPVERPSQRGHSSGFASAAAVIRRRPWLSGAAAAAMIGVAAFALSANKGTTQRIVSENPSRLGSDSAVSLARTSTPLEAEQPPAVSRSPVTDSSGRLVTATTSVNGPNPEMKESSRTKPEALHKTSERGSKEVSPRPAPTQANSSTDGRVEVPSQKVLPGEPSGTSRLGFATEPPVVVALPLRAPTAFRIGSRISAAFLYVDGGLVGRIGALGVYAHPPGQVHLQIQAEDCMTWDSVFVLKEGDTAVVGYRNPRCIK